MNSPAPATPLLPATAAADIAALRLTLRRCSPATLDAVLAFRRTGDAAHLPLIVAGLLARFADPAVRPRLVPPCSHLRLTADLGLDSLALMEFTALAEDVFHIEIDYGELSHLRSVRDVHQFLLLKIRLPVLSLRQPVVSLQ